MAVQNVEVKERGGVLRVHIMIDGDEYSFGCDQNWQPVLVAKPSCMINRRTKQAFAIAREKLQKLQKERH